jgi:hypothetical protein
MFDLKYSIEGEIGTDDEKHGRRYVVLSLFPSEQIFQRRIGTPKSVPSMPHMMLTVVVADKRNAHPMFHIRRCRS